MLSCLCAGDPIFLVNDQEDLQRPGFELGHVSEKRELIVTAIKSSHVISEGEI